MTWESDLMRLISAAQLGTVLSRLPGSPRVVAGGNHATPRRLLAILDAAVAEYRLFVLNAQAGMPDRDGVLLESPFVGPGMRGRAGLRYFPSRLSLVPQLLKDALPPDVVLIQTSVPVADTVSLGIEVNILPAAIEAVRARGGLVIAQHNPRMPYTYGDAVLAGTEIDYAIESDEALPVPAPRVLGDVAYVIGDRVARLVPESATLQLGIGAVPDAVLRSLQDRRGLAIWSEMFSDGVLGLEKAGALSPRDPITASFAFGSEELYGWLDHNERVRMLRTEKTNDPGLIARRPRLVSVNSALQVDLFAQAERRQRAGHGDDLGPGRRHPGTADRGRRRSPGRARRPAHGRPPPRLPPALTGHRSLVPSARSIPLYGACRTRRPVMRVGRMRRNSSLAPPAHGSTPASRTDARSASEVT